MGKPRKTFFLKVGEHAEDGKKDRVFIDTEFDEPDELVETLSDKFGFEL